VQVTYFRFHSLVFHSFTFVYYIDENVVDHQKSHFCTSVICIIQILFARYQVRLQATTGEVKTSDLKLHTVLPQWRRHDFFDSFASAQYNIQIVQPTGFSPWRVITNLLFTTSRISEIWKYEFLGRLLFLYVNKM